MMIDIQPDHLAQVQSILAQFVPDYDVWAFGSRVNGAAKKYSDFDLVLKGKSPLPLTIRTNLKDAFAESNLPIKVDVTEWSDLNETFRKAINSSHEVVQVKVSDPDGGESDEARKVRQDFS
jgi:uncharacterized protein